MYGNRMRRLRYFTLFASLNCILRAERSPGIENAAGCKYYYAQHLPMLAEDESQRISLPAENHTLPSPTILYIYLYTHHVLAVTICM